VKWHLVNPMGVSERTTEADSEFWAKRRFAPIPKGWYVQSDASYRIPMYQVKPELLTVCSKCNRHPAVEGRNQCEACASHKRSAYHKRKPQNLTPQERSDAARKGYEGMTDEAKARRSEKLKRIMPQVCERRDPKVKEKVRQANIRRGIEQRAARRAQQLSLFGA